ncbi:MAG: YciI family protein [Kiloniellaceae bacterium]
MYIVELTFTRDKSKAGRFMAGHKAWLQQGFDDGVFLLAGSLQPNRGGGILAHNTSLEALRERVNRDPFVAEGVVSASIAELTPARADARLGFLVEA